MADSALGTPPDSSGGGTGPIRNPYGTAKEYIRTLVVHIILSVFVYYVVIYAVYALKSSISLIDIVTTIKIVSIANLIAVNASIAKEPMNGSVITRSMNGFISVVCAFILVLLVIKLIPLDVDPLDQNSEIKKWLNLGRKNLFWMSSFPIVAYLMLDIFTYFIVKNNEIKRTVASWYLIYSDIPCAVPLMVVISSVWMFGHRLRINHPDEIEVFVGGSMTVIILVSAITAKTVDKFREIHFRHLSS